jgi:putative membrane protein
MKKVALHGFLAACVVIGMTACNNSTDSAKQAEKQNDSTLEKTNSDSTKKDASFAVTAADAGMTEVQLGQLAQSNSNSAAVKSLGKMMVDDHTKAGDELKALADRKGIVLPAVLSDKHQKAYNDLAAKKGADFDKAYTDMMVSDHKDVIDAFKKEADAGEDTDLKAWAQGKIPTLEHHLEMSQTTQDKVKKAK